MSVKQRAKHLVRSYWRPMALYVVIVVVFGGLLWWRLGSLVGDYSAAEMAYQPVGGLKHLLEQPLYAPFTLLAYLGSYVTHNQLLLLRLIATAFGLLTLTTFYWLARHWHDERSALLGTLLFGSSAWFLHTSRMGTPEVLFFMVLALVACITWLKRTSNPAVLLICFVLATTLLYVPGMIWFLALGVVWQWRTIDRIFKEQLGMVTIGGLLMLSILAPLGWAIYKSPMLIKTVLGLPAAGWPDPFLALHRLAEILVMLIAQGPADARIWLARLPVLAAFSIAMLSLGAYVYGKHWRLQRSQLVGCILVVGVVLIALGGAVTLSIIIPAIYMLITAGIGLLLDRWYRVFPRNTIAQGVGVGLICLAVVATASYDLRRYFIAWPATPATRAVFHIPNPHASDRIN